MPEGVGLEHGADGVGVFELRDGAGPLRAFGTDGRGDGERHVDELAQQIRGELTLVAVHERDCAAQLRSRAGGVHGRVVVRGVRELCHRRAGGHPLHRYHDVLDAAMAGPLRVEEVA